MNTSRLGIRTLTAALTACLLTACAGHLPEQTSAPGPSPAARAARASAQGDYARASRIYRRAASNARTAAKRTHWRLMAGTAAAQGGDANKAKQLLGTIDASRLNTLDRARYQLARKEIELAGMSPGQALSHLAPPKDATPAPIAQRIWEKRAELHFAQNDPVQGMQSLVQRDVWLVDKQAIKANDQRIYNKALGAIALGLGPHSRAARNTDATTRGWLALAAIGQRRFSSRANRDQALRGWLQEYPNHPATRFTLENKFHYQVGAANKFTRGAQPQPGVNALSPPSNRVTLALPFSGRFENAATAIRDGFMFGYRHATSSRLQKPEVIDTSNLQPSALLEQARTDNTGILVGPLAKSKVQKLSGLNSRIPTIALNHTGQPVNRSGFYQFSLSPEGEARSVARHALDTGYDRGLILVPKGNWGDRVRRAFQQRFTRGGGTVVDAATYDAGKHDHQQPIQSLLRHYHEGGSNVDFMFVAAQPDQGRLIRSQLRYYHAGQLPMLSTSLVYTGSPDPERDIDLNGVHFVDMPWTISHGPTISRRRKAAIARYGGIVRNYTRLFAMGMDAWLLTRHISENGLQPGDHFQGMTGVLSVQPDGSIMRRLAWAVFRHGRPQLLQMPSLPARSETPSTPTRAPVSAPTSTPTNTPTSSATGASSYPQ